MPIPVDSSSVRLVESKWRDWGKFNALRGFGFGPYVRQHHGPTRDVIGPVSSASAKQQLGRDCPLGNCMYVGVFHCRCDCWFVCRGRC